MTTLNCLKCHQRLNLGNLKLYRILGRSSYSNLIITYTHVCGLTHNIEIDTDNNKPLRITGWYIKLGQTEISALNYWDPKFRKIEINMGHDFPYIDPDLLTEERIKKLMVLI